jgi:hypothetical protein
VSTLKQNTIVGIVTTFVLSLNSGGLSKRLFGTDGLKRLTKCGKIMTPLETSSIVAKGALFVVKIDLHINYHFQQQNPKNQLGLLTILFSIIYFSQL